MAERILSLIIVGIMQGSVYGLLAMGLSLQYGVCRVINITHGEFVMLGAVLTYMLHIGFDVNPLLAPVILGPLLFGLGFLLQATLFRTLKAWAPSPAVFEGNALLAAFGVLYIIEHFARLTWGGKLMPSYYLNDVVSFLGMQFVKNQFVTFAIALALGVAVYLFLSRSRMGRAIRATAEDPGTAGLMGVNTNMILAFSFGLGALLAGIGGTLLSTKIAANTGMGFSNTVIALIVVVLGGLGSIPGSFVAGILIGIVTMLVAGLWEPVLTVPVYYAMLMILLLVRPTGILGKK
jgi:branched-chain amino acid transport system permease protein